MEARRFVDRELYLFAGNVGSRRDPNLRLVRRARPATMPCHPENGTTMYLPTFESVSGPNTGAQFPSTLLRRSAMRAGRKSVVALKGLCRAYWSPFYDW